jgi:choline-sulfatase
LFLAVLFAAGIESSSPLSNIILVTLDTTRADRMGFLGSKAGLTPNLDRVALESDVFTHAYSQVPLTTPSHATMLTGTYPQFSGLRDLGDPLGKEIPFLPDILHHHGYATAAFVGSQVLDPKSVAIPGFDRGFDTYDADFHSRRTGESRYESEERRAEVVVARAENWLAQHKGRPFFIWIHFYDPHEPYDPPTPFKEKYAAAPYDGEIAYVDSAFGKLLGFLHSQGLYTASLIAVAADHGEAFGEHGEEGHGFFLYDETIHVPLLIKLPGQRMAGTRSSGSVGLVDLAPTILSEAKIEAPPAMQGIALTKQTSSYRSRADSPWPAHQQYSETDYPLRAFGWSSLHALRVEKYLYVDAPHRELYDRIEDPGSFENLATRSPAVVDTLSSLLGQFYQSTSGNTPAATPLTMDQAEQLRALGYISTGADVATVSSNDRGADPKEKIQIANRLHRALLATEADQYNDAIALLTEVVKDEPNLALANLELGSAYSRLGDYAAAMPWLMNAVRLSPDSGKANMELGMAFVSTNRWAEAAPQLEAARSKAPGSEDVVFTLATVYEQLGRTVDAEQAYKRALEMDPEDYRANLFLGRLLAMSGEPTSALPYLRKAVRIQPNSADAHKFLANVFVQLGDESDARQERATQDQLLAKP